MTGLYIDDAARRRIATKWVVITLWALHGWASLLVLSVLFSENKNAAVIGAMFSTATFGIGATLGILLLDRAADVLLNKFAGTPPPAPASVTETVTRTVVPAAPQPAVVADLTVQTETVNVART